MNYETQEEELDLTQLEENLQRKRVRGRYLFHGIIGLFVIVMSFTYGLSMGLTRKISDAWASANANLNFGSVSDYYTPERLDLPDGVVLAPVGKNMALNGKATEMVSFYSNRSLEDLFSDQKQIWRRQGIQSVQKVGPKRGIAIGFNEATGERFSAVAWIVPPMLRRVVSKGMRVQGMVSTLSSPHDVSPKPNELGGEVPGVPLYPGGSSGSLLSSDEPGGRSYTGVYTNPASLTANIEFYRNHLLNDGWVPEADGLGPIAQLKTIALRFHRNREELVLLMKELDDGEKSVGSYSAAGRATIVTVVRSPQPMQF